MRNPEKKLEHLSGPVEGLQQLPHLPPPQAVTKEAPHQDLWPSTGSGHGEVRANTMPAGVWMLGSVSALCLPLPTELSCLSFKLPSVNERLQNPSPATSLEVHGKIIKN